MKYERLTKKRLNDGDIYRVLDENDNVIVDRRLFERFIEQHNRLAELEDKIQQGTLIELPCKVGDTVYIVYAFSGILEWEVEEIVIMEKRVRFRISHKGTYNFAFLSEKGETLFFTREEAEKRLKELQG